MGRTLTRAPLSAELSGTLAALQPLVRQTARHFAYRRRLPTWFDVEDLAAAANVRLATDLPRFDPALSSLRTFARNCCLYGMTDWLRSQDHLSRRHREQAGADACRLVRLATHPADGRGPLQLLEGGLWDEVRPLRLARLRWRERIVLALLILEGFTLKQAGAAFGVGESSASHIVAAAGKKLRGGRPVSLRAARSRKGLS